MRDIVERTFKHTFHLQCKNKSNDSKNQVIHKLHEVFSEQWSMQHVKLAMEKTYNNNYLFIYLKCIITKHVFV